MIPSPLAAVLLGLLLAAQGEPPAGATFPLKVGEIKLSKTNVGVFPEIDLRPQESLVGLAREPNYASNYPQKFTTRFGGEGAIQVAFAADEKRPGKGYATLVVDTKGDGDLSRGKRLSGKPILRGENYEDTDFGAVEIAVPIEGGTMEYPVAVRYSVKLAGAGVEEPDDSSLYLTSLCVLQGTVNLGEAAQTMIVFDANCNGVFGDRSSPETAGAAARGDKIWVGKGAPSHEDAYVQALPLGKYFLFDGAYWEFEFSPANAVTIRKAEVPLGTVEVSQPGFLLQLAEGQDVLCVNGEDGQQLDMPTGDYKVVAPGFRRKGKGGVWELEGKPGSCKVKFSVTEGTPTTVELGPPLKVVIDAKVTNRGVTGWWLELAYRLEGVNDEEYQYLLQNGKKVRLPEIEIKDSKGHTVKKGQFEYG
ncbi:MAG: hypothetical protein AB1726_09840 [Planctomycetota bacterium]